MVVRASGRGARRALKPSKILYYIDDDHAAKPGIDAASFAASEDRFARRADVVLASAPELVQRMRPLNDNVHYAPNVADTRLFATALEPGPVDEAVAALPHPRVLFVGAILAATIDIELMVELTRSRPDWSFAFVGPVGQGDPHTNIEACGLRPTCTCSAIVRRLFSPASCEAPRPRSSPTA